MLRWFLIVALALYGTWVSYLNYEQASRPHPHAQVAAQPQPFDCPKLHCQCQKGETPSEVPDDDPPADGNGS